MVRIFTSKKFKRLRPGLKDRRSQERSTWGETGPSVTLSILNNTWIKLEPRAGLRVKRQANNRLRKGTTLARTEKIPEQN
jgi:hypothetical protein